MVNVSDVVSINAYLIGDLYSSNYNVFDANRSLTIDSSDSDCVLAKVTMLSYSAAYYSREKALANNGNGDVAFPTVSGFKSDSAASSNVARSYQAYSYKYNMIKSNYTLDPASQANSSIATTSLIGPENRYPAYGTENAGIVQIIYSTGYTLSDPDNWGTGFIVGDHQIATAAHCVYRKTLSGENELWYPVVNIKKYNKVSSPSITLTPIEAHIPSLFIELKGDDKIPYDYALITVEEDLSEYVHFDLGASYNVTETNYKNIPLYVTGCPGELGQPGKGHTNTSKSLFSCEGSVYGNNNTSILHYNVDATDGQSGAPVYTITRNNNGEFTYTALSIHHGGTSSNYNEGSLITKYHLQFYKNNPYASYTRY